MKDYFDFFQEIQTANEHIPHDKDYQKNLLSAMSFFLQFKISEKDGRDRFYLCPACNSIEVKTGEDVSEAHVSIPQYKWFDSKGLFKNQDPIKKICFIHCDECESKKLNEESEKQNYVGQ